MTTSTGTHGCTSEKFWVKVARPMVCVTTIEVRARESDVAADMAVEIARDLPESAWHSNFDEGQYGYDIQEVRDEPWPDAAYEKDRTGVPDDDIRYLWLSAGIRGGVRGDAVAALRQPWLQHVPEHAIVAWCQMWISDLAELAGRACERIDAADKKEAVGASSTSDAQEELLAALLALDGAGVLNRNETTAARAAARRARMVLEDYGGGKKK